MTPELIHLCDIDVHVGPIRDLGPTPHGRRRIIAILGGRVTGPRLEAEIVPGGADWQYVRGDGVLELEARYSIRTRDGVEIAIINRGLRRASPEAVNAKGAQFIITLGQRLSAKDYRKQRAD